MTPEFGIFSPVFESAHGYLPLLGLHGPNAPASVALVRDCCERVADPFPDVCRLLTAANWRPHLVAAVAVIIRGYNDEAVSLLWGRLDTGSWVTPQIGVALSMVDPEFLQRARGRLEAGCPLAGSDLQRMSAVERHSAAGPGGAAARSAKAAQTLLHLVRKRSLQAEWLDELVAAVDFQNLLGEDIDGSGGIADGWSHRIKLIVSADGHEAQKG